MNWGLRDYGIEPVIWDGVEGCEHKWVTNIKKPNGGKGSIGANVGANKNDFANMRDHNIETDFCSLCNAWRGSLGLEPTFELYIKHLCDIFDEVKRVLRNDGTCWVNLGDTYWGGGNNRGSSEDNLSDKQFSNRGARGQVQNQWSKDYPAKSLVMIPQRFAIEMVNRGWILRNTIIWHKPNCMPSSASDRFTVDFEYLFFFVKSKNYWFEQQFETMLSNDYDLNRMKNGRKEYKGKWSGNENAESFGSPRARTQRKTWDSKRIQSAFVAGGTNGRNKRCVWTISTKPFPEAHFATFPEALIETPIQAGCPRYVCKKCGRSREKIYRPSDDYAKCLSYNPRVPIRCEASEYLKNARLKKGLSIKELAKNFPSCTGGITGCVWNWENGKALPTIPEWKKLKQILELDNTYDFIMDLKIIHGENSCNWTGDKIKGQQKSGTSCTADYRFKGYSDCGCNAGFEGGIVLDPFMGAGTTAVVAKKQGKKYIGIELKQEYIDMANKRLKAIPESLF